jgi:glycerol-3-phosphate dehydrogenase
MNSTATETTTTSRNNKPEVPPGNSGKEASAQARQQRVISTPNDVAGLVMMQIDAVSAKKDELTIAIKGLTDTSKQLVRAYAEHAKAIQKLQQRISQLEENDKSQAG